MNFTSQQKKLTNNRMSLVCRKGNPTGGLKDVSHVNTNDVNYVPTGDGDCISKEMSKLSVQPRVDTREEVMNFLDIKKQPKNLFEDDEKEFQLTNAADTENDIDLTEIPCSIGEERRQRLRDDNANNCQIIDNFYEQFYENLSFVINEYKNSEESEKYMYEQLDTFDSDSGRGSSLAIPEYEFDHLLEEQGSKCDLEIEL
uniref:Uncharacterized protein n=1 Tax=Strongyloides venezuelensis TaxID=75913 RepID=A0A0K0F5Q0_STRVS